MLLYPHRARQYHAAGQARRRPKFCPASAFCLGAPNTLHSMTPCVAAYVSRGWFLPVQLLRDSLSLSSSSIFSSSFLSLSLHTALRSFASTAVSGSASLSLE
eukprot:COSAG06_NODE_1754_length_8459_cov_28.432057_2_plen_102_part_00